MIKNNIPSNVYQVAQKEFVAIPGCPWVYWVNPQIRDLFPLLPSLGEIAHPTVGLQTGENFRFLRQWWEVGNNRISHRCKDREEAFVTGGRWFPYMKGGSFRKWYGNQEHVVNWYKDGREIQNFYANNGRLASRPQNSGFYFKEAVTYSYLTSGSFNTRYSPGGFIFDVAGSSLFPSNILLFLAILNSKFAAYVLKLINPTVNFQVGDLARIPIPKTSRTIIENFVARSVRLSKYSSSVDENTYDFVTPPYWKVGLDNLSSAWSRLQNLENQIDDEIFTLYGLSSHDRASVDADFEGGLMSDSEEDVIENNGEDTETIESNSVMTQQEHAILWISYAVGVTLDRFTPGISETLGSAIYRRSDFAIGSLPAPEETEFDELVSPAEKFSYVDGDGGRHIFPAQVEKALQSLALTNGIAVFDEGHPHDLPALVEKALLLMLGERNAHEVISAGAGGDLRRFLEKEYFTKYHVRWYRSRPVYWYIQSSKRSYGFVIFHEKITKDTLYTIQREPYLDTKRNAVNLEMQDLQGRIKQSAGGERKKLEKLLAELRDLADELAQFAKDLEEITRNGYEPEPDWIDDGVILRMAPLWKVIPLWKNEPKKYWERLEVGDFDWSHIAMKYWPKRVREKCKKNKSFAIAHGHEEWYEG